MKMPKRSKSTVSLAHQQFAAKNPRFLDQVNASSTMDPPEVESNAEFRLEQAEISSNYESDEDKLNVDQSKSYYVSFDKFKSEVLPTTEFDDHQTSDRTTDVGDPSGIIQCFQLDAEFYKNQSEIKKASSHQACEKCKIAFAEIRAQSHISLIRN